ncbi:MAG: lipocalin family protein, partial [Prochlorothrix sp.]
YWEGAVQYRGTQGDRDLQGQGYVELTGYADPMTRLLASPSPSGPAYR